MASCQPVLGFAGERDGSQVRPGGRPEGAGVGARVAGGLVEADPGDEARDIGSELDAELDGAGVVLLGSGHRRPEDRARADLRRDGRSVTLAAVPMLAASSTARACAVTGPLDALKV